MGAHGLTLVVLVYYYNYFLGRKRTLRFSLHQVEAIEVCEVVADE